MGLVTPSFLSSFTACLSFPLASPLQSFPPSFHPSLLPSLIFLFWTLSLPLFWKLQLHSFFLILYPLFSSLLTSFSPLEFLQYHSSLPSVSSLSPSLSPFLEFLQLSFFFILSLFSSSFTFSFSRGPAASFLFIWSVFYRFSSSFLPFSSFPILPYFEFLLYLSLSYLFLILFFLPFALFSHLSFPRRIYTRSFFFI